MGIGAAANADGNPTNELEAAVKVGETAIEQVTKLTKIESQLVSKAGILQNPGSGNVGSLSKPVVQNGLNKLNEISSSPLSRIWKGPWITKYPIPVYEFVKDGIGVVRSQATGELISVAERTGVNFDKLQLMVDNGLAKWLR